MDYTDKRRHKRIFFSKGDQMLGTISRLDGEESASFPVMILDISESGVGVTLAREHAESGLQKGDRLVLKAVDGLPILEDGERVEMEVRWVLDVAFLGHIGFGCQFETVSDSIRDRIRLIVEVAG